MWRLENQTGVIKQYPAILQNRQFTLASTSQVVLLKLHVFVIASEGNMMGSEHWFLHCAASVLLSYKTTFRDACAFFLIAFITLHAPLLRSNTTCIDVHFYILSSTIYLFYLQFGSFTILSGLYTILCSILYCSWIL